MDDIREADMSMGDLPREELSAEEWASAFRKKYRRKYTKGTVGKAVVATFLWKIGKIKHGIKGQDELFSL